MRCALIVSLKYYVLGLLLVFNNNFSPVIMIIRCVYIRNFNIYIYISFLIDIRPQNAAK